MAKNRSKFPKVLSVLTLFAAALPFTAATVTAAEEAPLNCGTSEIEHNLPNGAAWRMCARIDSIKGLVLEQVEFKPASGAREYPGYMRVLDEIYLSQLNVPYDTGHAQFNDITGYGFGDAFLLAQNEVTCLGQTIDVEQSFEFGTQFVQRTIPGICANEVSTGLSTHSDENQLGFGPRFATQGHALEVSSLSKISWYEYQEKITFDDNGAIDVALGATGDLAPAAAGGDYFHDDPQTGWPLGGKKTHDGHETHAASHWHSAIWRVDFGIGGDGEQFVEQWDYVSTNEEGKRAPVTRGTGTRKNRAFNAIAGQDHEPTSWWRIGNENSLNPDGHPRSYEIVNMNRPNTAIPETEPILTVINERPCAEYASENLGFGCEGKNVLDFVADDKAPLTNPIVWVNVGFHHIDRDEDQSPMPMHWQRFQLIPRDFFAQSPSITDARSCINGAPGDPYWEPIDSNTRSCIATNVSRPIIAPRQDPVEPGTLLTASTGSWMQTRTTWSYTYMWYRDGEPIITADDSEDPEPVTTPSYVVTEADSGAEITVRVTASQTGFVSATAESRPKHVTGDRIGADPAPSPSPTSSKPSTVPTTPYTTQVPRPVASTMIAPKKKKKIKARKRAKVKVKVVAPDTIPTGQITIVRKKNGKIKARGTLINGVVKLKLPRYKRPGKYRFSIRYSGSSLVKASNRKLVLKVRKR